jgi:hypothetical protein
MLWRARKLTVLLWPLIAWWAWDQPGTVVVDTTAEVAVLASFERSAWAQSATVVAGTKAEGAGLDCVRLNSVDTATQCGGGNDCLGHCSGLCSLDRRGISQPLWSRLRQLRALLWSLFARFAWAQQATMVA